MARNSNPSDLEDRYLGSLLGLAIGDAVGTTLEFTMPGSFTPITDMGGGGPFELKKGQWTDDTSMALCLAESLIQCGGFDAADQMRRYVRWWRQGHLSSAGQCFDIGNTVRAALVEFELTGNPMAGPTDPYSAGNGSLMRLAPIPLSYRANVQRAVEMAALSSKTTHGAAEAVDACRFMTLLIVRALNGAAKEELLDSRLWEATFPDRANELSPKIQAIAAGSYKSKSNSQISGSGYVVDCLAAALWAFHRTDSYREAILAAANLGEDADTTAAVCGQIAGAFYGVKGIPEEWLESVAKRLIIEEFARGLLVLAGSIQ
jgi:ADP-ribosylglycohydrolase